MEISFDDSLFRDKIAGLEKNLEGKARQALGDIGTELLRLSQLEVPLDKGTLQNSGETHMEDDYAVVGYNTPYAHRLHEHPDYKFQHNRKGKYLEDPMKNNLAVFRGFFEDRVGQALGGI